MTYRVKRTLNRVRGKAHRAQTYLRHSLHLGPNCPHVNLYHCSTQKTASQWLRLILRSVYAYSGLDEYAYAAYPERTQDIHITQPFPRWTFVSQLYIDYATYCEMPKPDSYRTFYILRDPRDIVVSEYFSLLYSHSLVGNIPQQRRALSAMSQSDGLVYTIKILRDFGLFDAQRSWIDHCDDPLVKIFHYEELTHSEEKFLTCLFQHCDLAVPLAEVQRLIRLHGFKALTGRERGQEDIHDHYRKGIAGDWSNYLDVRCLEEFAQATGDLVTVLGYQ